MRSNILFVAALLMWLVARGTLSKAEPSPAPAPPVIPAVLVDVPPVLDGNLDDPCWQKASQMTGFFDLYTGQPALERTVVYLCHDANTIYVAFHCLDSKPQLIHAFQTKREARFTEDDQVAISIDTYGGVTNTYWFRANPIGTQAESIPGGAGPKIEWRGDWSCAAKIVADGWVCEMAIPFSILRYTKGADTFTVSFQRRVSRLQRPFFWPNLGATGNMRLAAKWTGLHTPTFKPPPMSMLYLEGDANDDSIGARQGADVRYQPIPGTTALLTLNPDFKNIQQQVVSDSRPFFLEGRPPSNDIWYTWDIPQIDLGSTFYGTLGQTNFGLTHIRDFGARDDTALNWYHFSNQGYNRVGASLVNRHEPGVVENTVGKATISLAQTVGPDGQENFSASFLKSQTAGPGGDGSDWSVSLGGRDPTGTVSGSLGYSDVGAQFNPADGYFPVENRDVRSLGGSLSTRGRPNGHYFREWNASGSWSRRERHDGSLYTVGSRLDTNIETQQHTIYSFTWENTHRVDTDNLHHRDRLWSAKYGWNRDQVYRQGTVTFQSGRRASGHYDYTILAQGFYFGEGSNLQLKYSLMRNRYPDHVDRASLLIATLNRDLSPYRSVSARLVTRSGNNNIYASYRQSLRKGMDLFVIVGDPNTDTTQARLALKAVWCY